MVQDPAATLLFRPQPDCIQLMLERGLTKLTGKPTGAAAWSSLVTTKDVVGLKVFSSPGALCGTRPAVVGAVVEGLLQAGVPAQNIVIWDRQTADLKQAGFMELGERYGVRIEGCDTVGYDKTVYYESPLLGSVIWGDLEFGRLTNSVGRNSYVSKLLSQRVTKIINISPLLNNNLAGVSGNLYGLAIGSVDNTMRFESERDRLATAVPEIYALPAVGDRVVLNIVDALICQYEGGQRGLLHYSTTLNQLRLGFDPVALDVLSIQELERQRQVAQAPELRSPMELYQNASLLELGVSDPKRILVEQAP